MQVVALAAEPALAAALNMMDGWQIAFASEVEQASQVTTGAAVILVGGGTSEGLRIIEELRARGVNIPAVVLGDEPAPEGARYPVVVPPFTLEELRALVEIVVRDAATKAVIRSAGELPYTDTKASAVDPYAPPEPVEPERHLKLAPIPGDAEPQHEEPAPTHEPEEERPPAPLPPAVQAPPSVAPQAPPPPVEPPAPPPPPVEPPKPRETPAAYAPPSKRAERGAPIPPVPAEAVIVGPGRGQAVRRGLLRRRGKDDQAEALPSQGSTVASKLAAAANALERVEAAIEELPVLTDLRELTQALITEVVEILSPQVAGLYLPSPEGYRVWASHGFSSVERTMRVQPHQPLFADLFDRHEAVLIEPLDLATSLVSGIGGARTNAFLASPIEANGKSVGVIVAGREHFADEDLDKLESLTQEAAMGLAVALSLDQLRLLL